MSLMEQFADPAYFEGLSMGEKLTGATVTMCMGLGITFIVLIILWGCIAIMAKITHRPAKDDGGTTVAPVSVSADIPADDEINAVIAAAVAAAGEDASGELVAVIAAAIAAAENTVVSNLVVRKITRVAGPTNAWASAGLAECIDSRRM